MAQIDAYADLPAKVLLRAAHECRDEDDFTRRAAIARRLDYAVLGIAADAGLRLRIRVRDVRFPVFACVARFGPRLAARMRTGRPRTLTNVPTPWRRSRHPLVQVSVGVIPDPPKKKSPAPFGAGL